MCPAGRRAYILASEGLAVQREFEDEGDNHYYVVLRQGKALG